MMADTTNPITPPAQDLDINLAANEQSEEIPQDGNTPKIEQPAMDLDLNLDLPDAPKNDDRLKQEDQKNNEVITPEIQPVMERQPAVEQTIQMQAEEMIQPIQETKSEEISAPMMETAPIMETPAIEPAKEASTIVMTEMIPAAAATQELKQDMNIISELESNTNAGGLAPEAIVPPQPIMTETAKTFDLDAMLGTTPAPTPTPTPTAETMIPPVMQAIPQVPTASQPMFEIPKVATRPQTPAPMSAKGPAENKHIGVKVMLFGLLFLALGFTTYFILKTMYPIEFGNIFGNSQASITTGATDTGTIDTGIINETDTSFTGTTDTGAIPTDESLTGTTDTGTITDAGTGDHESAINTGFGELNDLGTADTSAPAQTDISRLTDYVTQGNNFLEQGKTMGNNTVIKYGLYISKKATSFLEQIASGEQITNLSGYFAQFDQYITELQNLVGQTTPPADSTDASTSSSSSNDASGMTQDTSTQNTNPFGVSQ